MARTLSVNTQFTAVDRMTAPIKRMTTAVKGFSATAVASFAKVERGARRLARNSQNLSNKLFNLRNAAGVLAAGFIVKKTYDMANGVAEMGDEAAKTSRRLGLTAEALQELKFAADRQGVSGEETIKSFEKLSKNVGDLKANTGSLFTILKKTNPQLLKQLQAANTNEEAFNLITNAVNKLPNQLEKASLAQAAFGRSGLKMLTVMENGTEGIVKLREEARKYGGVISNEAAADAEAFIDAQTNLKFALGGMVNTLGVALMPKIKELSERLTTWIGNNKELIKTKVAAFANKIGKAIEFMVKHGSKLITALKILIGLFVGLKVVTVGSKVATVGSKVAMLAMQAATISYNIATKTFSAITKTATAIQWAWNAAMSANPVVWIVAGVLLLIAAIAALIYYWEDIVKWVKESDHWFAKIIRFALKPIMWLFRKIGDIISWLIEKWREMTDWLKNSDHWFAKFARGSLATLVALLTKLGQIIGWVSKKWRELNEWIASIREGIAEWALSNKTIKSIADATGQTKQLIIEANRTELQAKIKERESKNPDNVTQEIFKENITTTTNNQKIDININDPSGAAEIIKSKASNINISKTIGWQ